MRRQTTILVTVLVLMTCRLSAHDLFLVTGVKGAEGMVCARIGEHFPESMNGLTADRVDLFQLRARGGTKQLTGAESAKQFCAQLPETPGVIEMVVKPRFIKLAAKDFNDYIHGENFRQVIASREAHGQTGVEGRELYSRYAKLLVGDIADNATRLLGHTLEIVPEKNPLRLKPGDSLPVRVLFRGKPLAGVRVSAAYEGVELKGHEFPVTAETDQEGRAILKLDRSGLWYARLIHMIPAEGEPNVDWRSFFATLTFRLSPQ